MRWRYLAGGPGGRTVILPSGGTRVPDMYLLLIEALERDFRVIAPAYPAGAGITGLADGLAAILDAEGVGRADVLGSSFGGFVAQTFARRHPDRVRRLVLANTGSPASAPLPLLPLLIRFLAVLPENAVRSVTGWNWRRWFAPDSLDSLDSQDNAMFWNKPLTDSSKPAGQEGSAVRPAGNERLRASAGRRSTGGAHPRNAAHAGAADRIGAGQRPFSTPGACGPPGLYPEAEVRLFAGEGHGVMATRSAEYIETVREFLSRP